MKIKKKHKLRKTSGPHIVGCTNFYYECNPDVKDDEKRVIPCMCFYPAKGIGEGKPKKYASESILPGAGGIKTNSYIKAPVCDGKHPLLLFNHGYSLFCEANTVQCEELASHGYIVLSIGHQGEGSYELPNGEILTVDAEMTGDFSADNKKLIEIIPEYIAWLSRKGKDASIGEHREYYKIIIDSLPRMTAHLEFWIEDSLAALEMFLKEAKRKNTRFFNHVNKGNIGAFGMSYGGAAALSLTQVSDLVKASANLDGFFFSSMWQKPIKKPIMVMNNDSPLGRNHLKFPFLNSENDAYMVTVKNSTHGNFADYNEFLAENFVSKATLGDEDVEQAMLGKIDPGKMEDIINTLLLDFFNKYLKGKDSQVIDTANQPDDVILFRK